MFYKHLHVYIIRENKNMKRTKYLLITLMLLLTFVSVGGFAANIPAFPGAEGFGANTSGGRGGKIIEVTNLNASGSGSLRAACKASGARIVVFRTGGTIKLTSNIKISNPYITIAGQSAPGDGICVRGAAITITTHDVIIRGLRVRVGDDPDGPDSGNRDCIQIENEANPPYNIVIDHCSVSWAIDENLTVWHPGAHDITISNSIISEALYDSTHHKGPHSMGSIIGYDVTKISYIRNLFAHNQERNPLISRNSETEIINNVIYNWGMYGTGVGNYDGRHYVNIIGNYYKAGANSSTKTFYLFSAYLTSGEEVYVKGNIGPSRPTDSGDEWDIVGTGDKTYGEARSYTSLVHSSTAKVKPAMEAYEYVLDNVGAFPTKRDDVDIRVVNDVRNGTGRIIDSQNEVGGWPNLDVGIPPVDTDHDGMSDSWEINNGLNPNNSEDRNGIAPSGYTWVEEYINSLIPMSSSSDTTAPSVPVNLTASAVSESQINLTWSASADNVGITGYKVYRNGSSTPIATTANTSYSDTGLSASTSYSYTVSAYDAAGNESMQSSSASATTSSASIGNTYYISTSGSDSNPGTQSQPWMRCPGMVGWSGSATLSAGDTVYFDSDDIWTGGGGYCLLDVTGGVTYDGSTWGSGSKATFRATGTFGDAVITFRDDHAIYETTVKGIEVDVNDQRSGGVYVNWPASPKDLSGATKRIEDCEIHHINVPADPTAYGIKVGATSGRVTRHVEILNNIVHDTPRSTIDLYPALNSAGAEASDILVRGNEVYNAAMAPGGGNGIGLKNQVIDAIVEYNYIHDIGIIKGNGITITSNSSVGTGPRNAIVRYNIIRNSIRSGIMFHDDKDKSADIYGNLIFNNGTNGIWFASPQSGNINVRIYNNTFFENSNAEILIDSSNANFSRLDIKNNIVFPRSGKLAISDASGRITSKSKNISINPNFKNTNNLPTGFVGTYGVDFHPNADGLYVETGSAIDGGVNLGYDYNNAINSVSRPQGSGWDIGAYEYIPGSNSPPAPLPSPTDTTAPSVPANLSAIAASSTRIDLSWNVSNDNVEVVGYKVYRNGSYFTSTANTSYSDTGLNASTNYSYTVTAYDAAGNESNQSGTASATTPGAPVSQGGLVGYWSYDEGAGSTAGDSTANGNDGVINGASWTNNGKVGQALYFDGNNDYVRIGHSSELNITGSMTLSVWVYPTQPATWRRFIDKGFQNSYYLGTANGTNDIGCYLSNTNVINTADNTLNINEWNHVVVTYDAANGEVKLYIDGVNTAKNTYAGTITGNTSDVYIGIRSDMSQEFTGKLDEVRIYNYALSREEAVAIYRGIELPTPNHDPVPVP